MTAGSRKESQALPYSYTDRSILKKKLRGERRNTGPTEVSNDTSRDTVHGDRRRSSPLRFLFFRFQSLSPKNRNLVSLCMVVCTLTVALNAGRSGYLDSYTISDKSTPFAKEQHQMLRSAAIAVEINTTAFLNDNSTDRIREDENEANSKRKKNRVDKKKGKKKLNSQTQMQQANPNLNMQYPSYTNQQYNPYQQQAQQYVYQQPPPGFIYPQQQQYAMYPPQQLMINQHPGMTGSQLPGTALPGALPLDPRLTNGLIPQTTNSVAQQIPTSPEGINDLSKITVNVPILNGYKDTSAPWNELDVPVFWHIPKAGGSTIKDIMGTCHRLCMAAESGIYENHDKDTDIKIVGIGGGKIDGTDATPFVNVDSTTIEGLERAKSMGLGSSELADAIVTPYIFDANALFDETHKGRLFTVFRHPVDRAVSLFSYLQIADWEPTYDPSLKDMTIEEYAKSDRVENNWMTRFLSNTMAGDLNDAHLEAAKEVVKNKFTVGLLSRKVDTMERLERMFRWRYHVNPVNQEKCREKLLVGGSNSNKNKIDKPQSGSEAYDLLAWQNNYDIPLYEFIEILFDEQETLLVDIPEKFRLKDATCCKCLNPPTCEVLF
mmetsp:Transcript_2948/g.3460  ORF Transcript_2948/g.3460 Transcript_2948/m.3460 type:complete len:604 (-) Transcript_2948:95-1906(-)